MEERVAKEDKIDVHEVVLDVRAEDEDHRTSIRAVWVD